MDLDFNGPFKCSPNYAENEGRKLIWYGRGVAKEGEEIG